jgi:hypothetical protein
MVDFEKERKKQTNKIKECATCRVFTTPEKYTNLKI